MFSRWVSIGMAGVLALSGLVGGAATRYVGYDPTQYDSYDTIQEAINVSSNGDEVIVHAGTYQESINFYGKAIRVGTAIYKTWEGVAAVIIDGTGYNKAVVFENGEGANSILEGITITNGNTCGIYCNGSSPSIRKCIINNSTLTSYSAGVYCSGGSAAIRNCIIGNGGGGDGILAYGASSLTVQNCIIYNLNSGSGIALENSSSAVITNNTITWCGARGICTYGGSTASISNCILWNNSDDLDCCSATYSFVGDGDPGTGNIFIDPHFVDPDNHDYHLSSNSPCINTGDPNRNYDDQTDIDGQNRVLLDSVDIGADESESVSILNFRTNASYSTIQAAIDAAAEGDEIVVSPGVYQENSINLSGKNVTVRSTAPTNWDVVAATVINAASSHYVFFYTNNNTINSVLSGFTITGASYFGVVCGGTAAPLIRNCIFEYNNNMGIGCINGGLPTIDNCIIRHNTYAGIYASSGTDFVVRNCLIYNNGIGIIQQTSGSPQIVNNTIVSNTDYGISAYSTATIANCILWDNNDDLYNCTATYSCIKDGDAGTGNIGKTPCFINFDGGNYHLASNSPCINTGNPNGNYDNQADIDGQDRVQYGLVDMGADEAEDIEVLNVRTSVLYDSIQSAIDEAVDGDEIVVYPGTYQESIDFLGKAITVRSEDPNDWDVVATTVIYSNNEDATVIFNNCEEADSIIDGFTVTGAASWGIVCGGNVCGTACASIRHCVVENNDGMGIGCMGGGSPTITHCIIRNNASAGIYANYGTPDIVVKNCLIYGNETGIWQNTSGSLQAINNTIVSNANYGIRAYLTAVIANCILWDNNDDLYNCTATYSCIKDGDAGTGNISDSPNFFVHDNGTYHLLAGSPCIDAGDSSGDYGGQTDIDGKNRVIYEAVDMGANEYVAALNVSTHIAYNTIQAAVNGASDGDVIVIYPGTYTGDGNRDIDFSGKAITVRSEDPCDWVVVENTIISCGGSLSNPHRGFYFHSNETRDSVIAGLTIIGGHAPLSMTVGGYSGSAIECEYSSPTISHCLIRNNLTYNLNTYYYTAGAVSCAFEGTSPLIENCIIRDNTACWAGAILSAKASPTIRNCLIYNNMAFYGGGILTYWSEGLTTIENCTITNNNSSMTPGGGLIVGTAPTVVTNCIIAGNSASREPVEVYAGAAIGYPMPSFSHCDVLGSGGSENWDESVGIDLGGNIDVDPEFVGPNNRDYRLEWDSPCLNVGDANGDYEGLMDVDNQDRVTGEVVDIGAYEYKKYYRYYPLNETEGLIASDSGATENYDAGLFNGSAWDPNNGLFAGALSLDGTDDYAVVNDPNYYGISGAHARTVSVWFKTQSTAYCSTILQWGKAETGKLWMISLEPGTYTASVAVFNGGVVGSTPLNDDLWHNIVAVLEEGETDPNNIKLYVDGRLDATPYSGPSYTCQTVDTDAEETPVHIGAWYRSDLGTRSCYFDGLIDDVRIYPTAWSAGEVATCYRRAAAVQSQEDAVVYFNCDEDTGSTLTDRGGDDLQDGTLNGATRTVYGAFDKGIVFDGTDDYGVISGYYGIGGTSARSVSLWFKTSTTSRNQALIQWGSNSTGELWLVRIETNGRLVVAAYGGGVYSSTIVTDGQWHHVVAVLDEGQTDSAQIRLYVDGVQEAYLTGSVTVNTSQTVPVHLGAWYLYSSDTLTNYFSGLMDEICIYDQALMADDVEILYSEF